MGLVFLLECEMRDGAFSGDRIVEFPVLATPGDYYIDREREGYAGLNTATCNLYAYLGDKLVTRDELPNEGKAYMRLSAMHEHGDKANVMLSDNATCSGQWFRVKSLQLRPFSLDLIVHNKETKQTLAESLGIKKRL